ncbi:MAG: hypothetical protein V4550_10935 [Gemmatimonadota bacterium]
MTSAIRHAPPVLVVRDARAEDNAALIALAASCPMVGEMTMCMERTPDFFTLSELEGSGCRVGVAELSDGVVGCIMAAERSTYVDGRVMPTAYVGDLKVDPRHRGGAAADSLIAFARDACGEFGGRHTPIIGTVLAGNKAMERRSAGPRGLPILDPLAVLKVYAIPFLWRRSSSVSGLRVEPARDDDIPEMAELWLRHAPERQFAPVLDAASLRAFVDRAPGLAIHDYLVARRSDGRIVGFMALWDQRAFKQLRVLDYSRRLTMARRVVNMVSPMVGNAPLPPAGAILRTLTALHLCAPEADASVLRALLLHAYDTRRGTGPLFFTLALDRRDPRGMSLSGLLAQPTAVNAFITSPTGRWVGQPLSGRPLYFESALV